MRRYAGLWKRLIKYRVIDPLSFEKCNYVNETDSLAVTAGIRAKESALLHQHPAVFEMIARDSSLHRMARPITSSRHLQISAFVPRHLYWNSPTSCVSFDQHYEQEFGEPLLPDANLEFLGSTR